MRPEVLFSAGFTDLVSVIPPGAQLAPSSKIVGSQIGKVPGKRLASGLYVGYDWRRYTATMADARQWGQDGANIGLKADRWPAVDIDSLEPGLAKLVEDVALQQLGPAPIRIGRAPKRLLMYRTDTPFGRMRLMIEHDGKQSLVEILGAGQQYLVSGLHPKTMRPYTWNVAQLVPEALTPITREQADAFLVYLADLIDTLGLGTVRRLGDGRVHSAVAGPQPELAAPSLEALREAVSVIPNTDAQFPLRDDYIKMGYAIRAAGGEEAFDIFAGWAARWPGNDRHPLGNDPDVVRSDWRRMTGPYAVGWPWIAELARQYGFNDAAFEFETGMRPDEDEITAPLGSDQWLAAKVVRHRANELRYVPARGTWLVWDGSHWHPDAELLADDIIKQELRAIADKVSRMGATDKEKRVSLKTAVAICSAYRVAAVRTLVQSDRAIALNIDMLDHDPWVLNTPGGIVDLKSGRLLPPDPDKLCTRVTAVTPDFTATPTRWLQFLKEATRGDPELIGYLRRLTGYALTGVTYEQQLTFVWGGGGNGKGTFLNTVTGILRDYYWQANMEAFTASTYERHTTELAAMAGARLVAASETESGKRWNEQRISALTGGDPITARFMRQDEFKYVPQFKLIFIGNHKPELRDVTPAIRRRLHIVPFTVKPQEVDPRLGEKLREEWPAILAWMIQGCLEWQREGLNPPASVRAATEEYLEDQDALGRWMRECTELDANSFELSANLYDSWREWCHRSGEFSGSQRRFSAALANREGVLRSRDASTRRHGFRGIRLRPEHIEFAA